MHGKGRASPTEEFCTCGNIEYPFGFAGFLLNFSIPIHGRAGYRESGRRGQIGNTERGRKHRSRIWRETALAGLAEKREKERKKKLKELQKARRKEFFLPRYSNAWMTGAYDKAELAIVLILLGFLLLEVFCFIAASEISSYLFRKENGWLDRPLAFMEFALRHIPKLSLSIYVFPVLLLLAGLLLRFLYIRLLVPARSRLGTMLEYHGTSTAGFFGGVREHAYEDWQDALEQGKYRIRNEGIELRSESEKLCFWFELGSPEDYAHQLSCYHTFKKHLSETAQKKLPLFDKDVADLFDHKFFYERAAWGKFSLFPLLAFYSFGIIVFFDNAVLPIKLLLPLGVIAAEIALFESYHRLVHLYGSCRSRILAALGAEHAGHVHFCSLRGRELLFIALFLLWNCVLFRVVTN